MTGRPRALRMRAVSAVAGALAVSSILASCAGQAQHTEGLRLGTAWAGDVLAPSHIDITPVAVVRTSGDVSDAAGLANGSNATATLTRSPGGPAPTLVVDYGEDVGGVPSVVVKGATGAPTLRVAYSEGLSYLSPTGDGGTPSSTASPLRYNDFLVHGAGTFTTGEVQGGERYQLLTLTTPGSVTLRRLAIHLTGVRDGPTSYRGWFFSSSPLLNSIWYSGAYTTQLDELPNGSFHDQGTGASNGLDLVLDGAKRDRIVWAGDLTVEGPTIMDSTDQSAYFRDSLRLLTSYQVSTGEDAGDVPPEVPLGTFPSPENGPIGATYSASYSMDVILAIDSYYRLTGDLGFVRSEWQNITRELAWNRTLVDARGLLITDNENGLDWDFYDPPKTGAVTAYNAIYVGALRDAAELADAVGKRGDAVKYRADAQRVQEAMNRYLWDPALGAYPVSDTQPGTVAQDGNALCILFGIAPAGSVQRILTTMQSLWTTAYGPRPFGTASDYQGYVSPFITNLEVQARFSSGDTAGALALIDRLWGHMLSAGTNTTKTFWEAVGDDGAPALSGFTSLAHGWSSGPTADLSSYVLGVEPRSAGYRSWTIYPHPGTLGWAEGRVATPHGAIDVHWIAGSKGAFRIQFEAPAGTTGTVEVMVPSTLFTIKMNGHTVAPRFSRTAAGQVIATLNVQGGVVSQIATAPK